MKTWMDDQKGDKMKAHRVSISGLAILFICVPDIGVLVCTLIRSLHKEVA